MEQVKKFFLLGFVPSVFGGMLLERSLGHITNVVHLYAWVFLFGIPIAIVMVRSEIGKEENYVCLRVCVCVGGTREEGEKGGRI